MTLTQVNLLNIGLMLLSAGVAFALPFETFLLSYAVLGPLHYLTQISWLHDRGWFTARTRDWLPLVVATVVIVGLQMLGTQNPRFAHLAPYAIDAMFLAFGFGLISAFVADKLVRWWGYGVLAMLCWGLHGRPWGALVFVLLLPSLLHVFVFTAAFVLHGALKSRSWSGHASLLVLLACGAGTLFLDLGSLGYAASTYAHKTYADFALLHVTVLQHLGVAASPGAVAGTPMFPLAHYGELFTAPASVQVGRFIAFAYTYHYLNWFSKTSVIRWHEVSRRRLLVVAVAWIASMGLYAIDYAVGLQWLLFLSFAHVLLEFPLDHRTFVGIGQQLMARIRG